MIGENNPERIRRKVNQVLNILRILRSLNNEDHSSF